MLKIKRQRAKSKKQKFGAFFSLQPFASSLFYFCRLLSCFPPSPAQTQSSLFRDATAETGLQFQHFTGATGKYCMPEIMGSGCALFDHDRDGDLDVFLVQGTLLDDKKTPMMIRIATTNAIGSSQRRTPDALLGRVTAAFLTVEMAVSAYHHRRLEASGDWEADQDAVLRAKETLRPDELLELWRAAKVGSIFRTMDLPTAIREHAAILRPVYRDSLLRRLAATEEEDARFADLEDESPELDEMRRRQRPRAVKLLDSFEVVGDHSAIPEYLLLLAATRGWPSPPSAQRVFRQPPGRNSMTAKGSPACSPTSRMRTTWGWVRLTSERISRRKRRTA